MLVYVVKELPVLGYLCNNICNDVTCVTHTICWDACDYICKFSKTKPILVTTVSNLEEEFIESREKIGTNLKTAFVSARISGRTKK